MASRCGSVSVPDYGWVGIALEGYAAMRGNVVGVPHTDLVARWLWELVRNTGIGGSARN